MGPYYFAEELLDDLESIFDGGDIRDLGPVVEQLKAQQAARHADLAKLFHPVSASPLQEDLKYATPEAIANNRPLVDRALALVKHDPITLANLE